jgi:hypothetical protein
MPTPGAISAASPGSSGNGTWVSIRAIVPPQSAAANLSSILADPCRQNTHRHDRNKQNDQISSPATSRNRAAMSGALGPRCCYRSYRASRRGVRAGVATPDHIPYLCPAAEPEEIPGGRPPDPVVSTASGDGVRVAILSNGLLSHAWQQHYWMEGVYGAPEPPTAAARVRSFPCGHGTFVAGLVRTMALSATVGGTNDF